MKSSIFLVLFAITLNSFAQSSTEQNTNKSSKKENPFINKNGDDNDPKSKGVGAPHPNANLKNKSIGRGCEIIPMFPGGDIAYFKFLKARQKYPKIAIQNREEGTVWIQVLIRQNGTIADPRIAKGVSKSLNNEAIRLIKIMPKWTPGQINGAVVGCIVHLPVTFKL